MEPIIESIAAFVSKAYSLTWFAVECRDALLLARAKIPLMQLSAGIALAPAVHSLPGAVRIACRQP